VEGKLGAWFARHGAKIAVLRPDRFVFGASGERGMERIERELRDTVRR